MIGDVLASTIICNNLKTIFPDATVHYLIYPFTKPVTENNPNIDRIILFDDRYRKSKKALFRFLIGIRKEKYDIVIDAYGKLESNLVTAMSLAKKRIGFHKSYTNFIYTDTVKELSSPKTTAGLAIENRMLLLSPFHSEKVLDNRPKIFLSDNEIANGRSILESHQVDFSKKVYMMSIIGSGDTKTYPSKYMAEVLDAIVTTSDATLLFNYMPSQVEEAEAIYKLCQPQTQDHIKFDLIPRSIREFLSLTYHCNALIGNEGGAVNMAKALGKPTFTIFSTWIIKEAWNAFEDGKSNVSVHLKDYKPELYGNKTAKEMKNEAMYLYDEFTPELILPQLRKYVIDN